MGFRKMMCHGSKAGAGRMWNVRTVSGVLARRLRYPERQAPEEGSETAGGESHGHIAVSERLGSQCRRFPRGKLPTSR